MSRNLAGQLSHGHGLRVKKWALASRTKLVGQSMSVNREQWGAAVISLFNLGVSQANNVTLREKAKQAARIIGANPEEPGNTRADIGGNFIENGPKIPVCATR